VGRSCLSSCTIDGTMACHEYIRLRQHHEAALTHWGTSYCRRKVPFPNSPPAVLEMKKKALQERNAAEERMIIHQRTCPICNPSVKATRFSR
jgi:hypothetical protein